MPLLPLFLFLLTAPLPAQLRIDPAGFQMPEPELRLLFQETIAQFPQASEKEPKKQTPPLFISHHPKGPLVLFDRTPRQEIHIQLNSGNRYHAQLIYQFAHELAHVYSHFHPQAHPNKWLEETLCETASLYALHRLSTHWEQNAPKASLQKYRHALRQYAQSITRTRAPLTPETSPAFYQKHRETLRNSHTHRSLNGAFAPLILPLFLENPSSWLALDTLPRPPETTLAEFFQAWRNAAPATHLTFLTQLEALFLQPTNSSPPKS